MSFFEFGEDLNSARAHAQVGVRRPFGRSRIRLDCRLDVRIDYWTDLGVSWGPLRAVWGPVRVLLGPYDVI